MQEISDKISYDPLFKTLKRKNISTYALFRAGVSSATYYRMKTGGNVTTETIRRLCKLLECSISDIIEYIPDGEINPSQSD